MQNIFNQLLQFLQQGIAAIFRFVQLIWAWAAGQIGSLMQAHWQTWPLWKQVLLVTVIAGRACANNSTCYHGGSYCAERPLDPQYL